MAAWKLWTLGGPSAVHSESNRILQSDPTALNNVDFRTQAVVQMRPGFTTSMLYGGGVLGGTTQWIASHLANDGTEEAWASSDDAGTPVLARAPDAITFGAATFSDTAAVADLFRTQSATQNGKLFLAYNSNVNRLHVWDGTSVRRVGLVQATAPTVASIGAGGLGFTRYYRQRNTVQSGGVTVRRSEPSTSVNITIAASSGVRVTKGAASGDGETHWEVEAAAAAAGPWYRIATVVVGTSTYDDTSASIATTNLSDVEGLYVPPPSAKYIITDGSVLLMAGAWESSGTTGETTPAQNRVWFTRPLGSTDISDDESITQTVDLDNFIDVGDAGPVTGLAGPLLGDIYVFKQKSLFKLVPTGNLDAPYQRVLVHDSIGALDQLAIASGVWQGVPAIFFSSATDLYVLTPTGLNVISGPISGDLSFYGLVPPTSGSPASATRLLFDLAKRTLWLRGQAASTDYGYLLDTDTGSWSTQLPTASCAAYRGAMIRNELQIVGGTSSDRVLSQQRNPGYVGLDRTTAYTASGTFRKGFAAEFGARVTVGAPTIWYRCPAIDARFNVTVSYRRDYDEVRTQTFRMVSSLSHTVTDHVEQITVEGLSSADVSFLDLMLSIDIESGDTAESCQYAPSIDAVQVPFLVQEPVPR